MNALITGTTSGIGNAIAKKLLKDNWNVTGIARSQSVFADTNYTHICMDLCDTASLQNTIKALLKETDFSLLINNAGVGYYAPHEELSAAQLHEILTVNVEVPMLLSKLLLRQLKQNQGTIINISSITAKNNNNTHGAAYGASKAALTSFGTSLFEEVRKYGVRVINIHPEMTVTALYRNASFEASTDDGCSLTSDDIADAVMYAVNAPKGTVINDITLRPQLHRISRKRTN